MGKTYPDNHILSSHYIIDGVRYDVPPLALIDENAEILDATGDIVDESREPSLAAVRYDSGKIAEYANAIRMGAPSGRPFNMVWPEHASRMVVASALIDMIWIDGHMRLGDLCACLNWVWETSAVGNMSGFYRCVDSVCSYLYDLGVCVNDYHVTECDDISRFTAQVELCSRADEEDADNEDSLLFKISPYESRHPHLSGERRCARNAVGNSGNWLIYIPFDPCAFKLGDSLLAYLSNDNGGAAPNISDPDYFIDCYEVVRELVEDGIITAGVTVSQGGLSLAFDTICRDCSLVADLSGIMASYSETDLVKILFSEIPGVLIEISDENFDYFDSQMILQDVAYYPVGHPVAGGSGIEYTSDGKAGLGDILSSLMGQASEGED